MRIPFFFNLGKLPTVENDNDEIPDRPPTPVGKVDPILLPNEIVLQVFPKKLCSFRVSTEKSTGFFSYTEPEYFHTYLTKKGKMGSLWVTSMRLIFVPDSSGSKGYSIDILDVTSMKTVESDLKVWFFLINLTTHIFTVPFSTQQRSQAFLKLISNLRFEHKVRQALPPPYRRKSESFYDCRRPSIDTILSLSPQVSRGAGQEILEEAIEEAIEDEVEDWADNDRHLPSYVESEHAVEKYLIDRGLLRDDGTPVLSSESPPPSDPHAIRAGGIEQDLTNSNVLRRTLTASSRSTNTGTVVPVQQQQDESLAIAARHELQSIVVHSRERQLSIGNDSNNATQCLVTDGERDVGHGQPVSFGGAA
ncbi:hypothetical protein V1514DRAFT_278297 [Lipomyces japonicus]|uniref:uncharacterized protein n=1 Tax=Lipomyces japonicus TaxID=56871 RepID=UPI0034CDC802